MSAVAMLLARLLWMHAANCAQRVAVGALECGSLLPLFCHPPARGDKSGKAVASHRTPQLTVSADRPAPDLSSRATLRTDFGRHSPSQSIAVAAGNGYRSQDHSLAAQPMLTLFALVAGAILGSFLNVCIVRLPAGESIVRPASHCRRCGAGIHPFDNIPLLSFMLLRGRCRRCGEPISRRYPLVEATTAVLFAILVATSALTPVLAIHALFLGALVVITFIDIEHQTIHDVITLPGIVIGLVAAALGLGPHLLDSVIGTLLGGGLLYIVAAGYQALTSVEGMGGGDIKLLAMIGAFLGWQGALLAVLLASASGSIYGALLILKRKGSSRIPIPFGPFLALGAACALFFGDALVEWYLRYVLLI